MDYTDEELSRILTAHDEGLLIAGGGYEFLGAGTDGRQPSVLAYCGCANQVAYNEPDINLAMLKNIDGGRAFDNSYQPDMSPEEVLQILSR